jgi:hypothetical protein
MDEELGPLHYVAFAAQEEAPTMAVEPVRLPALTREAYGAECGPAGWYPEPPRLLDISERTPAPFDPKVFAREAVKSTERVDCPPPIVTSTWTHENWEEEWYPAPARTFAKRAREAGWDVRVGFSRGYIPGRAANTYAVRDIIGVWLDGFGKRAVVTWERNPEAEFTAKKLEAGIKPGEVPSGMKWSPSGGAIMIGKGMAFPHPNLTEMTEWVALQGSVLPSWYEACRRRAAKSSPAESAESTV